MLHRIFKPGAGRALLAIMFLSGLLMLYRLDGTAHRGRYDDVNRALVARNMAASGDWTVPILRNRPLLTKPPLMYWTAAAIGRLTGRRDELPGDLTSVLSLLVTIACTWWIGRNLFGEEVALRAGLILSTMYVIVDMGRHTLMDTVMTAAMLIVIGSLVQLVAAPGPPRRRWWLAAALGLAATVMTKGPVGLPILAFVAVPLLWGRRDVGLRWWQGWGLFLLLLALILPWFILILHRLPEAGDVWRTELLGRMSRNELTGTWPTHPAWFYLPQLIGTAPWLPLLFPALGLAWARRRERSWLVLFSWVVGSFLFLSLVSSSKRAFYLLPLYPGMALMIAGAWPAWFAARVPARRGPRIAAAAALGAILLGGLAFLVLPLFYPGVPQVAFRVGGALALAAGGWGLVRWLRSGGGTAVPPVVAGAACLYLAWFGHLVPLENDYLSGKPFFTAAASRLGSHEVVTVGLPVEQVLFYLGSPPYLNETPDRIEPRLREDPQRRVVTTPEIAASADCLSPVMERTLTSPWGRTRRLGLYRLRDSVAEP